MFENDGESIERRKENRKEKKEEGENIKTFYSHGDVYFPDVPSLYNSCSTH